MCKKIIKKLNIKKKTTDTGEIILTGNRALLLAEACKLNKQKKAAKKRLTAIKKEMNLEDAGDYVNKAGDLLKLTMADKYSDINPEKLFNLFVKNRKKAKFWDIIKVQLGPLAKIIPEASIKKLRKKLDPTPKWSFK